MWCVTELGLAFEHVEAGGPHGGLDAPEYREINPNGRVPTIDDDGFILWESNAIVRYLAARHGMGSLCPDDPRMRADADRWMAWQAATVGAAMRPLIIAARRTPPAHRDAQAIAKMIEAAGRYWAILDDRLKGREYVMGAQLTMADIPMGAYANRWYAMEIERPAMAHLDGWFARLTARAPYRRQVIDAAL